MVKSSCRMRAFGIEELCDPGGHSVHLDAGQRQLARKRFRREGEEEARSATGLEHAPAVEAHLAERPPDGADHELRREMRVLRRPLEIREILARDELFELEAEIFPCGGEAFAGAAKEVVGEVRGAERREFRQLLLLVRSGVTAFGLDRGHEPDRGEIVFERAPSSPGRDGDRRRGGSRGRGRPASWGRARRRLRPLPARRFIGGRAGNVGASGILRRGPCLRRGSWCRGRAG